VRPVYLDHAATTQIRSEVREAMLPFLDERFGNPSSTHRWGRQARNALEESRERIAASLGAHRREIVFTGGGTEADNLAVLGRWKTVCLDGRGPVVYSAIEHKAVGSAARQAGEEGARVIVLGVDGDGRIDLGALDEALKTLPCVVSVMWGNNEIGTLQPVEQIADRCRAAGVTFHTDAVQAFGKVRVRVDEVSCDLLALSAHKIGGPKGIGALFLRDNVAVLPLTHGGGQERQLRPGTENVAGAVGFAVAAELAVKTLEQESSRLRTLRDRLQARLLERIPDIMVMARDAERLPHVLNVLLPDVDQEALLIGLDLEGLAVSGASACASGTVAPSHVLTAIGRVLPGSASIRMSLGHPTTESDVDAAIEVLANVCARVRVSALA
jgi:cysteine desulfurase